MNELFFNVGGNLAFVAISTFCGYIFARLRQQRKNVEAIQAGLQCLLRDRIIQAYNHYVVEKGYIPIYAKQSIMACYESYETLGSNGVINDLIEQIRQLPNKGDEDEDN